MIEVLFKGHKEKLIFHSNAILADYLTKSNKVSVLYQNKSPGNTSAVKFSLNFATINLVIFYPLKWRGCLIPGAEATWCFPGRGEEERVMNFFKNFN